MTVTAPSRPRTRAARARVKAVAGERTAGLASGQFRALVSVFGNVDSYGEVVMPGAFTDTLAAWEASGDSIPVIWSHKWDDPFAHLGHVVSAKETPEGLEVVGQVDVEGNEQAAHVYRLLKARRINQFSFAYDVRDSAKARMDDADGQARDVTLLNRLDLHEVGPCLIGVNRDTDLLDVKSLRPHRTTPGEVRDLLAVTPADVVAILDTTTPGDVAALLRGA